MARRALVLAAVLVFVVGMAGAVGGAPRGQSSDATPKGSPVAGTPDLLATVQAKSTTDAESVAQTVTAVATRNAELEAALVSLATSEAIARQAAEQAQAQATESLGAAQSQATAALGTAQAQIANDQATIAALSSEVTNLEASATANAIPTATPTDTPTPSATPTETPMPSPTPTPTPLPQAGDVLYATDTNGFEDWPTASGWKTVGKTLVNDGSNSDESSWLVAPVEVGDLTNYAVEAEIQFVRGDLWGYGIVVRGTDRGGYWVGVNTDCRPNCHVVIAADSSMSSFINFGIAKKASKLDNDWHTYRVEVVDNTITFLIDGKTVLKTTDNTFLEAGRVGMFDYGTQINVRSFRVIAL